MDLCINQDLSRKLKLDEHGYRKTRSFACDISNTVQFYNEFVCCDRQISFLPNGAERKGCQRAPRKENRDKRPERSPHHERPILLPSIHPSIIYHAELTHPDIFFFPVNLQPRREGDEEVVGN